MNNNPPNTNYGVGSGVPGAMHGSPSMLGSQGVGGGSGDKYSGNFSAARNLLTIYPSDKALMAFIYDFMRRKSLDTVADLFAQQVELTTEQLNGCVDFAQNNFGPSPPSGLLVSWWQTFWEVLCFRQANPTMVSMVQGHQQIVNTQQPPMPILSDADAQRLRLQLALSSTGILGRDLNALGPTERNLLSNTLQQYKNIPIQQLLALGAQIPMPSLSPNPVSQQQVSHQSQAVQQQILQKQMAYYQKYHSQPKQPPTKPQALANPVPLSTAKSPTSFRPIAKSPNSPAPPSNNSTIFFNQHNIEDAVMNFLSDVPTMVEQIGEKRPSPDKPSTESSSSKKMLKRPSKPDINAEFYNMPEFELNFRLAERGAMRTNGFEDLGLVCSNQGGSKGAGFVHISSDGCLLVSAGQDLLLQVYDISKSRYVGTIESRHTDSISVFRLCRIGNRRIGATGSFDKTVRIWDFGAINEELETLPEKPLWIISDLAGSVVSCDFAKNVDPKSGIVSALFVCDCEGNLTVCKLSTGECLPRKPRMVSGHTSIRFVRASPCSLPYIAVGYDDRVDFYDWEREQIVYSIQPCPGKRVIAVIWEPGILLLATYESAYIWAVDFGITHEVPDHYNGRCVASISLDNEKIGTMNFMHLSAEDDTANISAVLSKTKMIRRVFIGCHQKLFLWDAAFEHDVPRTTPDPKSSAIYVNSPDKVSSIATHLTKWGYYLVATCTYESNVRLWRFSNLHNSADKMGQEPALYTLSAAGDASDTQSNPSRTISNSAEDPFDPISLFLNTE